MLVIVSFIFLANTVWYKIKAANVVFNWATKCTAEMNKNFLLLLERMNCSDQNIHWSYIIQNDVTQCIMGEKNNQANDLCHMIFLLDKKYFHKYEDVTLCQVFL